MVWREYVDDESRIDPMNRNYRDVIVMYGGQENQTYRDSDYVSRRPSQDMHYASSDDS